MTTSPLERAAKLTATQSALGSVLSYLHNAVATIRGGGWPFYLTLTIFMVSSFMTAVWLFDIEPLQGPVVGVINAKFNTCLCFTIAACAQISFYCKTKRAVRFFAYSIILLGGLTAVENFCGVNLHIDQIFVKDNNSLYPHPGRMAPLTSVCFFLAGIGLLIPERKIRGLHPTELIGYFVAFSGLLSLVGYAYRVPVFFEVTIDHGIFKNFSVMAFNVAILFLLFGISLIALNRDFWFYRLWTRNSRGGEIVRTLLPLVIGLPLVCGYLKTYLQHHGLVSEEGAITLIILGMVAAFTAVICRLAEKFDYIDEEKRDIAQQREDLLFALAHDMKVPLIGSDRVLEQIIEGRVINPGEQKEYLNLIRQSNDTLLWTIQNILYKYKQESGLLALAMAPTTVQPMLEYCQAQMRPLAQGKGLELNLIDESENGSIVYDTLKMDQEAVKRIVLNLIHNAVKFTSSGCIDIVYSRNEQYATIAVKDTGIGITAEGRASLFKKFGQTAAGRKYSTGSGLGLHFSKQLMQLQGGEIKCDSEVGEGSTFTLVFPV